MENKEFQERMRKSLLARRAALINPGKNLHEETDALREDGAIDPLDQGQVEAAAAVTMTLNDQDRRKVTAIDAALERLAQGHYGICAVCDDPIPQGRLEIIPEARTCTECG